MADKYAIETVYRVFDNENGGAVTVGPDRDGVGCVEVWTDAKDAEVFGSIRLVMQPAMARLLADALEKAADDSERNSYP